MENTDDTTVSVSISDSGATRYYPFDGSDLIQLGNIFRQMGSKCKENGLDYKWVKKAQRQDLIRELDDFVDTFAETWAIMRKKMVKDIDLYYGNDFIKT